MKIIVEKNAEQMSETAKNILLAHMLQDKRVNLSITAGNTPVETYQRLSKAVQHYDVSNVHYYNFDEIPVKNQKEGVTLTDLRRLYLTPAQVPNANIHPLTPENYATHQQTIANAGGLDLMLIGLGQDGHFCGNMPTTTQWNQLIYPVTVTGEEPWFVPEIMEKGLTFVTMGPASVMKVRHLVLIVNGKQKAETVKKVLTEPISEKLPASILQLHPNFTVVLDEEAASQL